MKRIAALAVGALLLGLGASARADTPPSLWSDAKQPGQAREYAAHVEASQILFRSYVGQHPPLGLSYEQAQVWRAQRRRLLEGLRDALAVEKNPTNPYLRFDRAWLAIELVSPQESYPLATARTSLLEALAILEPLAQELGQAPFSAEVWHKLAECYVRLERPEDEIRAYDEELARATSDGERAVPMMNQGEAYMRTGKVDIAVTQFREVLRLSGMMPYGNDIGVLAQWDIAIALDRGGDARGGLEAARVALRMDNRFGLRGLFPISVFNSDVYFVPAYEREWYLGLGEAALALDETTASAAVTDYQNAEEHLQTYVDRAKPGDRWLDVARKRLTALHLRRVEAEKRARTEHPAAH